METTSLETEVDVKLEFEPVADICRVCLCTNGGMLNVLLFRDLFEDLAGISISESDGLPQWLCMECSALLRKSVRFKSKMLRAQDILYQQLARCAPFGIEDYDEELAKYSSPYLSQTNVLTYEVSGKGKNGMWTVLQHDKQIKTTAKIPDDDGLVEDIDLLKPIKVESFKIKEEIGLSDYEDNITLEEFRTTYNHNTADQPAKPIDRQDLSLPSRTNVLKKAQAPRRAAPCAEPPTVAAPKSKAQRQREYRQRLAASRTAAQAIAARKSDAERKRNWRLRKSVNTALVSGSLESTTALSSHSGASFCIAASTSASQAIAARKTAAERQRNCRQRKAANSILVSSSLESTTAFSSRSGPRSNEVQTGPQPQLTHQQLQTSAVKPAQIIIITGLQLQPSTSDQIKVQQAQSTWSTKWACSILRFKSTFLDNDFGYACSVCDRLWFKNDLKPITAAQLEVISEWFIKENRRLCREEYEMVCNTCKRTLNKKSMPPLAKVNGFYYPDQPPGLPPLDPISERLISPRLPFMQVRRLRHDFSCGIIGQVIHVPVNAQEMVKCLPRQLNEDDVINVNIERKLAHKSVYISEYMSQSTISAWLTALQNSSLYRLYEINVDFSRLHPAVPFLDDIQDDPSNRIENISTENMPESEIIASRQHTMMWNEEDCLNNAPGHQATPLDTINDRHAEELSFPSIYFGEPRRFHAEVPVSSHMIATSEIRRRDRRGATPQKILYVAMKILRLRMVNGISSTFRNVSGTENVTRRMLEDTEFLKEYVIQNLAFMKTVPNSVQYRASRKRDLFAMIRQLGKPTFFLTINANEIGWIKLLTILLKLSKKYPGKTAQDLKTSERCSLVSDDPVTCCIYFYRLVGSLMKMLKSKQSHNPFGKYFVKDYFLRIEFHHRGSPRAHTLLWLNDDPRETVSENMPRTIELVEKLCSVARDDVPNDSIYANQIHKHTFTCTKRGKTTCRFGFPFWPMPTTRVLVPIPQSDGRRQKLQQKAKELRTSLVERRYTCIEDFLNANSLTYISYIDIVRSTLHKPTLVFRRNFDELMTNTFNPYLAGEVNSNIDIQFILDENSCAEYVVEYMNKSSRGMGSLRRELTTMMREHPDQDHTGQLKALSVKLLNSFEMSAQEAAWYLLRQPMSETSRPVVYIPTVWPSERQRCRKRRLQMDREGIDGDSTDIWTKNIIQRYEERPPSLEQVYLAEFASWYANANDFIDEEEDVHVDDDEDSEAVPEARTSRAPREYRKRSFGRVIRYRRYDIDETVNYKREMVLLYVQFRNEMSEIIDQNIFLQLFDDNKDKIMERHSLFETNLNIENVVKELEAMMILKNDDNSNLEEESKAVFVQRLLGDDGDEKRSNVMSEQQNCELVRTTNPEHWFSPVTTSLPVPTAVAIPSKRRAINKLKPQDVLSTNTFRDVSALHLSQEPSLQDSTECHVKREASEIIYDAELKDINMEPQGEQDAQIDNIQCSHLGDPLDTMKREPDDVEIDYEDIKLEIENTGIEGNEPNDAGPPSQSANNMFPKIVKVELERME